MDNRDTLHKREPQYKVKIEYEYTTGEFTGTKDDLLIFIIDQLDEEPMKLTVQSC